MVKRRTTRQICVEAGIKNLCMFYDSQDFVGKLIKTRDKYQRRVDRFGNIYDNRSKFRMLLSKKYRNYIRDALSLSESYQEHADDISQKEDEIVEITKSVFEIPDFETIQHRMSVLPNLAYIYK